MIFTIGLGNLTDARELRALARRLDATIHDVRASLKYRRAGFGRLQLAAMLGASPAVPYVHRPELGGLPASERAPGRKLPAIDPAVLRLLAVTTTHRRGVSSNALLVCACAAPGQCHRHVTIGYPLATEHGAEVWHIYNDAEYGEQAVDAVELQRAIDDGDDYEFTTVDRVLR